MIHIGAMTLRTLIQSALVNVFTFITDRDSHVNTPIVTTSATATRASDILSLPNTELDSKFTEIEEMSGTREDCIES